MFSLLPALIIIPPVSSSDRSFFRIPLLEDFHPSPAFIIQPGMTRGLTSTITKPFTKEKYVAGIGEAKNTVFVSQSAGFFFHS